MADKMRKLMKSVNSLYEYGSRSISIETYMEYQDPNNEDSYAEVTITAEVIPGIPPSGMSGPPENYDPGSGPEIESITVFNPNTDTELPDDAPTVDFRKGKENQITTVEVLALDAVQYYLENNDPEEEDDDDRAYDAYRDRQLDQDY